MQWQTVVCLCVCACATRPVAAVNPASGSTVASACPSDLGRWRVAHDTGAFPGETPQRSAETLAVLLACPDPEVRDGLAYEIFERWILRDRTLDGAALDALAAQLRGQIHASAGPGDDVFGRSFSVLVLSLVVARDVDDARWGPAELGAVVEDAAWYAAHEADLRGHTGESGWAHAAAHTADLLKWATRHRAMDPRSAKLVLGAVRDLVVRRHGHLLHHGEDGRLVQPMLELLQREAVTAPMFDAWLVEIAAPSHETGDAFDLGLYAAQRNARNLLVTLYVTLDLDPGPATTVAVHAHQALRDLLTG